MSMKSKILSVIGQKCTEKFDPTCTYFGPWVYPRGSYLITHVRPSVVRGPSLDISETALWIFLIFCMKLVHYKGTKVTESDFWKKISGVTYGGKPPFLGYFWCFFLQYFKNSSNDFNEILRLNSPHWYLTPCENRMP